MSDLTAAEDRIRAHHKRVERFPLVWATLAIFALEAALEGWRMLVALLLWIVVIVGAICAVIEIKLRLEFRARRRAAIRRMEELNRETDRLNRQADRLRRAVR